MRAMKITGHCYTCCDCDIPMHDYACCGGHGGGLEQLEGWSFLGRQPEEGIHTPPVVSSRATRLSTLSNLHKLVELVRDMQFVEITHCSETYIPVHVFCPVLSPHPNTPEPGAHNHNGDSHNAIRSLPPNVASGGWMLCKPSTSNIY